MPVLILKPAEGMGVMTCTATDVHNLCLFEEHRGKPNSPDNAFVVSRLDMTPHPYPQEKWASGGKIETFPQSP
jgi:hypothetical protein